MINEDLIKISLEGKNLYSTNTTCLDQISRFLLPPEIFKHILAYLQPKQMNRASLVSRDWHTIIIASILKLELYAFDDLKNFLIQHLQAEQQQDIEDVSNLRNEKIILNSSSLGQFKLDNIELLNKTVNIIKKLSEDKLINLNQLYKKRSVLFFPNLFAIAKIYRKIEERKNTLLLSKRIGFLREMGGKLIKKGWPLNQVLELIDTIEEEKEKREAYQDICYLLTKAGQVHAALKVVNRLLNLQEKTALLQMICQQLIEKDFNKKALEIARIIPLEKDKEETVKMICEKWIELFRVYLLPPSLKSLEEFLEIIESLSKEANKIAILWSLFEIYEKRNSEKALVIAFRLLPFAKEKLNRGDYG